MSVSEEIAKRLEVAPPSLTDSCPAGKKGSSLRKFASFLDPVSAREMKQAIEEGCEQIDGGEW
jgi:hypothetical protein